MYLAMAEVAHKKDILKLDYTMRRLLTKRQAAA